MKLFYLLLISLCLAGCLSNGEGEDYFGEKDYKKWERRNPNPQPPFLPDNYILLQGGLR